MFFTSIFLSAALIQQTQAQPTKNWYQAVVSGSRVWLYGWPDATTGFIRHTYHENPHIYPTSQTSQLDAIGLSQILTVRPDLVWDARLQAVAEEHADQIARIQQYIHFGFREFPSLVSRLQAQGYPVSVFADCVDLGSSSTESAGIVYIDRRQYGNWPGQTHYETLRNPNYHRVGFATKGGFSTTILAK